jgi:A/G-specific adenine glycosylase
VTHDLAETLLNWYARHARDLPWRWTPDPYTVWVSEIMLQQTQVRTVIPYFERWMKLFPSIASLASASQREVLAVWEGLGYYSRARNMHRAARLVMEEYNGELPRDTQDLRQLPGIGRYTAGAIASIAFGLDEPAMDGNARRVLARFFNVALPARSSRGERLLWELAGENLPAGQAAEYNQALMDLGAMICTPREPDCSNCPLALECQANQLGLQEELPVKLAKRAAPHHTVTAGVIYRAERVLITKRPIDGLLGGMWEFPGGKMQPGEDLVSCLQREIKEELAVDIDVGAHLGVYQHAYTHFRVTLHAFRCSMVNGLEPQPLQVDDLRWVTLDELPEYPMGKIDRLISIQLLA